ncbi:XRE family transcriptional regulator [Nonomuraea longispora]|uniref:XRE family transcriptional regulator n=1 Tax=Nonomuraea longispora TaxID=1848320 RepID=A0A4R4N925_9ACTN|nr:helix-turn-helix transcriptional regulator [Nonomuraea longispora]TDC02982.1 XRE family transcriptional regulator [Nonomuraea longispora]
MTEAGTIGARLRGERQSRGFTQEELAEAAGLSRDLVAKLEQGQRRSARLTTLVKLANALDIELSALVGKRDQLGTDRDGGSVLALRDALLSPSLLPGLDDGHDGEPTPIPDIERAVAAACRSYWRGDFPALVATLPDLLAEARLTHSTLGASAVYPLAMAYDLAASVTIHLGRDDLAAVSAERAITTAHAGDDELLWAGLHGTYAWVLHHQARLDQAERLAISMAERIEPAFSAPAEHLATWGKLLLAAFAPAAAAGREVADYAALAAAAAERLRGRVAVHNSWFGSAMVAEQETHAYTVLRLPDKALRAARRIHAGDLEGIAHGRHLIDIAQAHVDSRHHKTAAERLLEARAESEVWFRHQAVARDLVEVLREEERRPSTTIRSLANSLGI